MSKRKWSQLIFTIFHNSYWGFIFTGNIYTGFFKRFCAPGLNCSSCPASLFACPLGILQNFLASFRILPLSSLIGTFFYILSFFLFFCIGFGRFICGWICPFGFFQELIYKIPFIKKTITLPFQPQRYFKYLIFFTFVIIIPLFVLTSIGYGVLGFCKYLCPAGTLEAGIFNLFLHYDLVALVGMIFYFKVILLFIILLLCLIDYRFFCKNLCPLGLIYGFFNKIGILKLSFNSELCTSCKLCEKVCPLNLTIPEDLNSLECIRCLNCLKVCPTKAITLKNPYELL